MTRGLLLSLWGWMVLWSVHSGRLDLLLRGVFHGLVGASGALLLVTGIALLIRRHQQREPLRWHWLLRWDSGAAGAAPSTESILQ